MSLEGIGEPMAVAQELGEQRKQLGAFYTPSEIARFVTEWAIRASSDRVLEPAAGEAAFLVEALIRLGSGGEVVGVEIDARARAQALAQLAAEGLECEIRLSDFLQATPEQLGTFDAVIGNPPYIRYHRFRGEARRRGLDAAAAAGVHLSGLASSWASFVVHGARFLGPDGRLAFVLPSELLHVDYAQPVRDFLLREFGSVTIVRFEEAVFPGAMIDTLLLLAERGPRRGLQVHSVRNVGSLSLPTDGLFSMLAPPRWSKLNAGGEGRRLIDQLRESGRAVPLGQVASVDIGCVTGANSFFILTASEAAHLEIPRSALRPILARPNQLKGAVVRPSDVDAMRASERCLLLHLRKPGLEVGASAVARYLQTGRRSGVHRGYKCSVRRPWYSVPGVRVPDAFMSYMSHHAPRIALNGANLTSTNLVHQLTFKSETRTLAPAYVAALHSSPSLLSFELEGRSYGGGVLKHETREAERVLVPVLDEFLARELGQALPAIDSAIRSGDIDAAADIADGVLARHGSLPSSDLRQMRLDYKDLEERRALRGRTSA